MTDYSTLKSRALQLLGDPDGTRYDDATLQEAFRQALATYTRTCPQVRTEVVTFASAGAEQPLVHIRPALRAAHREVVGAVAAA